MTEVVYKNIFSMGDVCQTKLNEEKSLASIMQLMHIPAHNIRQVALGTLRLQRIPNEIHTLQMVPMGAKRGVLAFNKMVQNNPDSGKVHAQIS